MVRFLAVLLLLPATLGAQSRTVVSAYLGADATVAGDPLLVGLTAAKEQGPLAARLSMGFDMTDPAATSSEIGILPVTTGIWSTDADALLYVGNPRGSAALIPYAVAGVGVRGYRTGGDLGAAGNYSYGGGFRAPLGGGFAMEGEVRHREMIGGAGDSRAPEVSSGFEYRFGMSVGFGGALRPAIPNGGPMPLPPRPTLSSGSIYASADSRTALVSSTLNYAERFIGTPYQWGGNTPAEGFDCSGFIRYVFAQNGLSLPRVSRDQARFGMPLPLDIRGFQPGDILAFASNGRTVDHTAIYAGNGRILHSSSSGRGVRYDDLYSRRGSWYVEHLVAARRVVDSAFAIR